MLTLFRLFQKILKRVWRIITFRRGIYCTCGKKNRFGDHVFLHEYTRLGNYNYVGPYTQMLNARVGNFCSISTGVKLGQTNHDYSCVSTSTYIFNGLDKKDFLLLDPEKPTVIENDVWLAANVIVKQGVTIGTGAVVGAGSVVTKDIPPYEIWAGVPAKFIKKRFSDDCVQKLLESRWWEKDLEEALPLCKKLQSEI